MAIETPIKPFKNFDAQQRNRQKLTEDTGGTDRALATIHGTTGHVKKWDPVTAGNLERLENSMALNPPKTGWVVVLHPWPIAVNGGRMMREPAPPAGHKLVEDGKLIVHRHRVQGQGSVEEFNRDGVGILQLDWFEPDLKPEEAGHYSAEAVLPIQQASQYAREGNSNALWGPGVLIYDGDLDPVRMYELNEEVSLFGPLGDPVTRQEAAMVTPRGSRTQERRLVDVPVTGKFREALNNINEARLENYLRLVNEANDQWISAEGKEKKWYVNLTVRLMAQTLFKSKRIPELPPWAMESRLDAPATTGQPCISCGAERVGKLPNCKQCAWPFDPLESYKQGLIEFEHVSISALPIKQLEEAYKIKAGRDEAREKMEAKFAKKENKQP